MADFYKTYEATLTTTKTLNVNLDLGAGNQGVKGGYIINDDAANDLDIQFAFNSTTSFGDTITLKAGEQLKLDIFRRVTAIKLVHDGSNDIAYRVFAADSSIRTASE